MKRHNIAWSEEELKQLTDFVAAGGTPLRASVRVKRTIASCRIQARKMGVPFEHTMISTLAKCAAAEKELSR
jgi:hypothetical protein